MLPALNETECADPNAFVTDGMNVAADQAPALHQLAANCVLEVLHLVPVGRPMQGVRPSQARQRLRVAQSLGVLPGAAVRVAAQHLVVRRKGQQLRPAGNARLDSAID